ncbi:hypothetical protein ACE3NQ_07935 [Paenibacillus terreus]|uniref:Uncharacterized protein n=1 Tax=Paenibacillus terreus TaxID=1387834 RepID=A0ABV5B5A5_9BACL
MKKTVFDPTVFDNLKVAIENQIYDLDNIDGVIRVTGRDDRLEMSVMAREFAIRFQVSGDERITAEIRLEASLRELAAEILEQEGEEPGCRLQLRFMLPVRDVSAECPRLEEAVRGIWGQTTDLAQRISYIYGQKAESFLNTMQLDFRRKINEEQMEDLPELIDHVLRTLVELRAAVVD